MADIKGPVMSPQLFHLHWAVVLQHKKNPNQAKMACLAISKTRKKNIDSNDRKCRYKSVLKAHNIQSWPSLKS